MLYITIPESELFNSETSTFIRTKEQTLQLEHSLVSLSKWESEYNKPFVGKDKTPEELLGYIRCMTLTQNVNPDVYLSIPKAQIDLITKYLNAPMTATTINNSNTSKSQKEVITAELIYYWMVALNIPFECQKWHLNRLLTLVQVCNVKNTPAKKMSQREIIDRNRSLNASRRQALKTKG